MKTVTLLKTGLANLASVQAAFDRLGARTELAESAGDVSRAERLVVPGVGAFEACLLYTSPSPRDKRQSRMPSSA